MEYSRNNNDLPLATADWGWKYHHIGVPMAEPFPGEEYIPHLGIYVSGFTKSPYGIEFMRFTPECKIHDLVKKVPHVAFVVDDLIQALIGKELLGEVNSPSPGLKVAMIVSNGAPIELMEFENPV
ncbi:MAG TPA: hypothetical protein PLP88_12705 [Bacteroidales bacterium]|nr:hypothetical protein [Bacteroidales bacterium]